MLESVTAACIHPSITVSMIVLLTQGKGVDLADSADQNITQKASIQLFSSAAVKARLSSMLLSLSYQPSQHVAEYGVFNKASEELSTPVCTVRLMGIAKISVGRIAEK